MTADATETTRAPMIDVIVESELWDAVDGADETVRSALTEAAAAIGADFRNRMLATLLTDDAMIARLNAQWRNIDNATNVLSFPAAPAVTGAGGIKSLGDIAIAYETTAREARDEGKQFSDHLAHLAVHGFLHLLGYDHDQETQAEEMERLERVILARIGVPDPYLTQDLAPERLSREIRG
jgi:probable rRNA maturation factor